MKRKTDCRLNSGSKTAKKRNIKCPFCKEDKCRSDYLLKHIKVCKKNKNNITEPNKIDTDTDADDNSYIELKDCIEVLKKGKPKKSKEICKRIKRDNNIIDPAKNIFQYDGHKFMAFFTKDTEDNWQMWLRGLDVTNYLGYTSSTGAIMDKVDQKNTIIGSKLKTTKLQTNGINSKSIFINYDGLIELLLKSNKPKSIDMANFLNIKVHHKYLRKETYIVHQLYMFCKEADIRAKHLFAVDKPNGHKYFIDYYLLDHKIAIEIDEFNHSDRDEDQEKKRERYIKKTLGCKFIRCDPDDPDFSVATLIGKIYNLLNKGE